MKTLMQHKAFIYKKDSNDMYHVAKDIAELLEIDGKDVFLSNGVKLYDCRSLKVEYLIDIFNEFYYFEDGFKILVFSFAESLSSIIQNKLLKAIEEADEMMKIIFISNKPMLPTIESRSIKVIKDKTTFLEYPNNMQQLINYFCVTGTEDEHIINAIKGFHEALYKKKPFVTNTGAIKEKSKSLDFLSNNVNKLASLVILFELKNGFTPMTIASKRFLEAENNAYNLYQFLFELDLEGRRL